MGYSLFSSIANCCHPSQIFQSKNNQPVFNAIFRIQEIVQKDIIDEDDLGAPVYSNLNEGNDYRCFVISKMGQEVDCFILPIHKENQKLKKEINEMLTYIKELQENHVSTQKLFECLITNIYIANDDKHTQTDMPQPQKPKEIRELKLNLKRNWNKSD
eukprot:NODE_59_length_25653_cov_0.289622.p14 type:complete len:158 gc:universal NODE_59_length_25653_cov_0.289622:22523-22996(+)